jgi:hypothetical protein
MVRKCPAGEKEFLNAVDRRAAALIKAAGYTDDRLRTAASLSFVIHQSSVMMEAIIDAKGKTDDTIDRLSKRLEALEGGRITYKGFWQRARSYSKGSSVTEGSSTWIAIRATIKGEKPGLSDAWQLADIHGPDGRDARRAPDWEQAWVTDHA